MSGGFYGGGGVDNVLVCCMRLELGGVRCV